MIWALEAVFEPKSFLNPRANNLYQNSEVNLATFHS